MSHILVARLQRHLHNGNAADDNRIIVCFKVEGFLILFY